MKTIGALVILLLVIFVVGVALIVGIGALFIAWKSKQTKQQSQLAQSFDTTNPSIRAHQMLLETDHLYAEARQDLAFAQAQFGELATREFSSVLRQAQDLRDQAFAEEPRLQDPQLITAIKIESAGKIINLCEQAQALLKSQQAAFDSLRRIEAEAPANLQKLRSQIDEVRQSQQQAQTELASLGQSYGEETVSALKDYPARTQTLLEQCENLANQTETALQKGDNAQAVRLLRDGQNRVSQALELAQAVLGARNDLSQMQSMLVQEASKLGGVVDRLERAEMGAGERAPLQQEANEALSEGEAARNGQAEPLAALNRLRQAQRILEEALAPNRQVQELRDEQRRQAQKLLPEVAGLVDRAIKGHHLRNDRTIPLAESCQEALAKAKEVLDEQPAQSMVLLTKAQNDATNLIRLNDYHSGKTRPTDVTANPYGVDPTWMVLGGVMEDLVKLAAGRDRFGRRWD